MARVAGGRGVFRSRLVGVLIGALGVAASVMLLGGCFWERGGREWSLFPPMGTESLREVDVEGRIASTKEASELRRVREEHRRLIESIPTPEAATPTKTKGEAQLAAAALIVHNPEGYPTRSRWMRTGSMRNVV